MRVGLTYDLRSEYLAAGYGEEETAEFDRADTIASTRYTAGHHGQGQAWDQLAAQMGQRRRRDTYSPDRTRSIGTRARRY